MHRPDDVDRMVAYLQEHREEIIRLGYGRVSFDLFGGQIKARLERSERLPEIPARITGDQRSA